ncbi:MULTISPECIES: MarR family winged helix-turn-helix transcriptional regulator [Thermoactinomyces]|jgi:DNA-binding MarR family transcriptional regulator|uniref:MarR family transcriptional regulator n=1 Tax=Thermoactinomyces daqus TaxID=1329516 RepID=A0A7W1X7Y1_9BACL|nr:MULTISPECIES: MarR family transcriptional regulator [Thermoactinomyces]MBA4541731.1 MarR family transcriptional regulator [Thermoactinomyces daqus]MBH8597184.1 MarR family transcriptional regulator [Thermoactinomyces sp. CICC 10523]MBH8602744.1 MarR family transcriptional regulator [Thermoactinomyces sp. CICC 10522]
MIENLLNRCLYFTTQSLAREIRKMAEETFAPIGLSPTYAFIVLVVIEQPGITSTDLGKILHVSPSTVTRFVDKLILKGLVERKTGGKLSKLYPTEAGVQFQSKIQECWDELHKRYSEVLGKETGDLLSSQIVEAMRKLTE